MVRIKVKTDRYKEIMGEARILQEIWCSSDKIHKNRKWQLNIGAVMVIIETQRQEN